MRRPQRLHDLALAREINDLAPARQRRRHRIRAIGLYRTRGIDRERPLPALPGVARLRRAVASPGGRVALELPACHVARRKTALSRDLADMRMVYDDQVVGARQFLDRIGFEILERPL